jgi:hypothetical protein
MMSPPPQELPQVSATKDDKNEKTERVTEVSLEHDALDFDASRNDRGIPPRVVLVGVKSMTRCVP